MSIASNKYLPTTRVYKLSLTKIAFWTFFALNYLYLSRLLSVLTTGTFRLGLVALGLSLIVIAGSNMIVRYIPLALVVTLLSGVVLLSTMFNNRTIIQFIAFVRIPIIAYLIYNLVWHFFNSKAKVYKVFRFLYILAAFQLPVIAIQRLSYPYLPERLKFSVLTGNISLADFGMGTFSGDTSMAFALIGLIILLLFDKNAQKLVRRRWLMAAWLSLTVLFSNSQIQHLSILMVWGFFLITKMSIRTFIVSIVILISLPLMLSVLSQAGITTVPPIRHTLARLSNVTAIFEEEVDEEVFFQYSQAREVAISYYLNQPIKWLGDGPGSTYNTITRERSIGGWGHIFTFYAEVGFIGWILSVTLFFVIAFPIYIRNSSFRIRVTWVAFLMFLAVHLVTMVKYPLGNSALVFTYCVILIGHQTLGRTEKH